MSESENGGPTPAEASQISKTTSTEKPGDDQEQTRLVEQATRQLRALLSEAQSIDKKAGDYYGVLGLVPDKADVQDVSRIKSAYRRLVNRFHPDRSNVEILGILKGIKNPSVELSQLGLQTAEACKAATQTINGAWGFLSNNEQRAQYVESRSGVSSARSTETEAESTPKAASRPAETKTDEPRPRRSENTRWWQEQPLRGADEPNLDREFSSRFGNLRSFMDRWSQLQSQEQDKIGVVPPARLQPREAGYIESRGERVINQLTAEALENIQKVIDVQSLKLVLENLIQNYQELKAHYWLPKIGSFLPSDISVLLLQGFTSQLEPKLVEKRQQEGLTWNKNTPESRQNYLRYLIACATNLIKTLQPNPLNAQY